MSGRVSCRRVYQDEPVSGEVRVLVDALWPRGVRKERLPLAAWLREVAPSAALRRWYGHDPGRFAEFTRRYAEEIRQPPRAAAFARLRELAAREDLVLLTATRDLAHSHAAVLAGWLATGAVPPGM